MSSLIKILSCYGYTSKEQQLAFIKLLYLAHAFDTEIFCQDLKAVNFSQEQIKSALNLIEQAINDTNFNADLILTNLFSNYFSGIWPETMLNWLIRVTQREFFARKRGQERWQQETGKWILQAEIETRKCCKLLGLENKVLARYENYPITTIFGSTYPEMKLRMQYLKELIDTKKLTTQKIYFLCGERPATVDIDGDSNFLKKIAAYFKIEETAITEIYLAQYIYKEENDNSLFYQIPFEVIGVSKKDNSRPTTVDTLYELIKKIPHYRGNILFISRAPSIKAQEEETIVTLQNSLPQAKPEIIGNSGTDVSTIRLVSALGAAFYAGYARVAKALGAKYTLDELNKKKEAYNYDNQTAGQL